MSDVVMGLENCEMHDFRFLGLASVAVGIAGGLVVVSLLVVGALLGRLPAPSFLGLALLLGTVGASTAIQVFLALLLRSDEE